MTSPPKTPRILEGITPDRIPFEELSARREPVIMKGLVSSWPLVQAGLQSAEKAMDLLVSTYSGKPELVYIGDPSIKGRFYYNDSRTGLNYRAERMNLVEVFDEIRKGLQEEEHPYYFIPSLFYAQGYPDLQADNSLPLDQETLGASYLNVKSWIGTESITGAHYDMPNNIACCAVGRRRFTLFPPDQIMNMYPGPFTPTPGGQVTTLVDIRNPDFDAFPRFRQAQAAAVVADLEPGDALYYPSMWWHEVEAKDRFNTLVNYWWNSAPRYMADPVDVVMHAILGLRDRPQHEKQAWREIFDYYIFGSAEIPRAHVPEAVQGVLAELDENMARRLRATLQQTLNR